VSPCEGIAISQDVFEAVLRNHVVRRPQVTLALGHEEEGLPVARALAAVNRAMWAEARSGEPSPHKGDHVPTSCSTESPGQSESPSPRRAPPVAPHRGDVMRGPVVPSS
jgi:hypothetical protein